jgi:hypothetical protein
LKAFWRPGEAPFWYQQNEFAQTANDALFFDDFRLYSVAAKSAGAAMWLFAPDSAFQTRSGNDLAGSDESLTAFAA